MRTKFSDLIFCAIVATTTHAAAQNGGVAERTFRTFFVTRSLTHERLIPYLETARPEIVQIGNYGAMFHGYADNEKSTGWPMQLPVSGERAALTFQRELNQRVHQMGLTVVGHFRLVKVMGNWDEKSGFVEYYNQRWPRDLLGPKPHADVTELLQRDVDGKPIQLGRYNQSQLALCLSSPHARQMLKAMLKVAIDNGVDGIDTNFNYRFDCACPYCQAAFKEWLSSHLTVVEIREQLGIENLQRHVFPVIPASIPGYPDAAEASRLDWLAKRWGAEHFKQKFDEIFIDYGRSLKKNLIVAQWNHLSHVSIGEERAFLPLELWGRGEDYFWYSGGAAFVGKNLNLAQHKAGDAWLSCLYVREMGGGKPFVIGKYDHCRMAASMAEGFATGGMGMGRYMRFEEPAGFEVLARYTRFMHGHRQFYDGAVPYADVALVLPRQSVLNHRPDALDAFRDLGQALVERQVLIDVVADERITPTRLAEYPSVILTGAFALSDGQLAALRDYAANGGKVIVRGDVATMKPRGEPRQDGAIAGAVAIDAESIAAAADTIAERLQAAGNSTIDSPWTVRSTAYKQPGRVILHLVNFDREEGAPESNRTGPETERPQAVENVAVRLRLPAGRQATAVTMYTPDGGEPVNLDFQMRHGQVWFAVPHVLVYALTIVDIASS